MSKGNWFLGFGIFGGSNKKKGSGKKGRSLLLMVRLAKCWPDSSLRAG